MILLCCYPFLLQQLTFSVCFTALERVCEALKSMIVLFGSSAAFVSWQLVETNLIGVGGVTWLAQFVQRIRIVLDYM